MLKNKKGITLVALVVTIVVLLILAGVSINLVLGDNGIIAKAKDAETKSAEASQNDLKGMNGLVSEMEGALAGNGNNGGETQTPEITIGEAKVVANSDGTGSAITDAASVYLGNTLYITFAHSITGGTTTVDKTIPYAVTKNGTYTFTITGTVNGKNYIKNVSVTVNQFKDVYEYMQTNTKVTYSDGDVWIPEGFRISTDAAEKVQGGIVIEDKDLNQFVWVPVATLADYKRTAYSTNVATEETDTATNSKKINFSSSDSDYFTEALQEDEKISVEKYKGFYIGRYEAGDKDSTEASTPALRTRSSSTSNKISIKANQAPYNNVTKTQAISLAEGFATKQGYKAKTKLVSSYAWDTTIACLQKVNSDYGSSSEEGNYIDTTFLYTDITGTSQTKANPSSVLVPTGQTTQVCNIYDMGGNVWEWTTEFCSNTFVPNTIRGGGYFSNFATYPAGSRGHNTDGVYDTIGFRITLFM